MIFSGNQIYLFISWPVTWAFPYIRVVVVIERWSYFIIIIETMSLFWTSIKKFFWSPCRKKKEIVRYSIIVTKRIAKTTVKWLTFSWFDKKAVESNTNRQMWTDRHDWKHYILATSLAGGKNCQTSHAVFAFGTLLDHVLSIYLHLWWWSN